MRCFRKPHFLIYAPLFFFGKRNCNELKVEWKDRQVRCSVVCQSGKLGVPRAFDLDVYNCLLYLSQKKKENHVRLIEIAECLGIDPKGRKSHIRQSLERLYQAQYQLHLRDGTSVIQLITSLEEHGRGRGLYFSYSFPKEVVDGFCKRYQWIDMEFYISLPCGTPRRLYEFLAKKKNQYRDKPFVVSEEALAQWLPVHGKYPSDRIRTIAKATQILIDKGYLEAKTKIDNQCSFYFIHSKDMALSDKTVIEKTERMYPVKIEEFWQQDREFLNMPEQLQQQFIAGTKWIKKIASDFSLEQLQEFSCLELANYFPDLEKRFLQAKQDDMANKAGWILAAIRGKWLPKITQKEERQKQAREAIDLGFQQLQQQRLLDEEKKCTKQKLQQECKNKLGEFIFGFDIQELWTQAENRSCDAPRTARERLSKFYFCEEIVTRMGYSSEILDFHFCDYVAEFMLGDRNE